MAVLYLPEDPRTKLIGEGLGGLLGNAATGYDTARRVAAMKAAIAQGQPIAAVEALAGPNKDAQAFAKTLAEGQVQQQQIAASQTQQQETQANIGLIHQKVQESVANIALEQANTKLEALKAQLLPEQTRAENARSLAEAQQASASAAAIKQQMDFTQTYIDNIKKINQPGGAQPSQGDLAPGATGDEAVLGYPTLKPSPTTGLPADFSFTTDALGTGLVKANKWNTLQSASGGLVPKNVKSGTPISRNEEQAANDIANLSETMRQMLALAKPGPNGKVNWGPISGNLAQLAASFKNDPKAANDPDVAYKVLTGHETFSTITGFGSSVRGGPTLAKMLANILANAKEGQAMNIQMLQQSARILRQSAGDALQFITARRPNQEIPLDPFKMTDKNTQEILAYNPLPKGKGDVRQGSVEGGSASTTTTTAPKEGDTDTSKSGKPIIFHNGQWEYQ
jgi:hypothetical protein